MTSMADSLQAKENALSNNELMTIKEVADFLRISTISAYSWVRDGKLPAIRIGKEWRVRSRDLDEWLEVRRSISKHPALD
jgi:excisionase family DNA binding protein